MKKLFTMLFVAGIATGAFAYNDEKSVEIRQTESTKVSVSFRDVPQGIVIVKITDENNQLVLRDRISKTEAFAKRYDLTALPAGSYSVEVADQNGVLRTATFTTEVSVAPSIYSRVSKVADNKYRLMVSSMQAKEVTVYIYDGEKLIHSEVVENPQGLHKIYSISKPGANISFRVASENGFDKFLSVR
jgi:hypothetical protein